MVEAPWINMLACTTPQWISSNMSSNTIGGGFTSRCIFVYGDKKERPVAYIKNQISAGYNQLRSDLIHDLEHIALNLAGSYELTPQAEAWGNEWYERLWTQEYNASNEDFVNGYLSRKQAHLHKLALVLAASQRDDLVITEKDLQLAEVMLNSTQEGFSKVFSKIGRTDDSLNVEKFLDIIRQKGTIPYADAYKYVHVYFPDHKAFEGVLAGAIRAGFIKLVQNGPTFSDTALVWIGKT